MPNDTAGASGEWMPEDDVMRWLGIPKGKLKNLRRAWCGTDLERLATKLDHHLPYCYDRPAMAEIRGFLLILGRMNRHLHAMMPLREFGGEVLSGEATGALIPASKAAALLGVSEATMERWQTPDHRGGPRYKLVDGESWYMESDVTLLRDALIGLGKYEIALLSTGAPLKP